MFQHVFQWVTWSLSDHSALPRLCAAIHVSKRAWLCAAKGLFIEMGSGLAFADSCSGTIRRDSGNTVMILS